MSDHHRPRNPAVIRVQGSKPIPAAASPPLPVARSRVAAPVQPAPRPAPQSFAAPNAIPLRTLEADLSKLVIVPTTEIDDGVPYPDCKGQYVWRDETGEKCKWGPKPISYEFHQVKTVAEADEIMFLCPLCFIKNGGAKGTHSVLVSFAGRNLPDDAGSVDSNGKPSRWNVSGSSLDDLVLTPSILLDNSRPQEQGCHWHGFVGSSGVPAGHAR